MKRLVSLRTCDVCNGLVEVRGDLCEGDLARRHGRSPPLAVARSGRLTRPAQTHNLSRDRSPSGATAELGSRETRRQGPPKHRVSEF